MAWAEFGLALAAFYLSHLLPARPGLRARLVAALGSRGFGLAYSALSLVLLYWLIVAGGRAPRVALWWVPGGAWLVLAAMLPVCLILALALGRPNPFSFGGPAGPFDPARPGIVAWLRHPLPVALMLWSGAHLLANGDVAHVVMFGGFLALAALAPRALDRRNRRRMGPDWPRLTQALRAAPRPGALRLLADHPGRTAAALGLYLGLLLLHPWVIGASPLP